MVRQSLRDQGYGTNLIQKSIRSNKYNPRNHSLYCAIAAIITDTSHSLVKVGSLIRCYFIDDVSEEIILVIEIILVMNYFSDGSEFV